MQYLYEEQHYIDRYDLLTIKHCLEIIEMFQKIYDESLQSEELKDVSKQEKFRGANQMLHWQLFTAKAQEYKRKKETVQKWMTDDKREQDKYDHTPAPLGIYCPKCKVHMGVTSKILEDYMDQPLRVLFFFDCPSCKKRLAIYDNGEEHISKPQLCPKCKKEIETTHKRKGSTITWTTTCSSCGFTETTVDDFDKMDAERDKRETEEKELLAKHRKDFCLSDEQGKKDLETLEAMVYANEVFEEEKQKYDNTAYQQAIHVRRLGIVELERTLLELLEKEKYIKLTFGRPEIGQFVHVPFTLEDADSSRKATDSISNLQKIIKDALESTNWRLVEGIDFRLGYISGKLKGYEREDDITELFTKKREQKPPVVDNEKRMKYASNNWVQIARITGKYAGIEAVRKRRLEKEPNGFFLEDSDGSYNCSICGNATPARSIWWNLDGLRCRDCWRNIQEGVIPPLPSERDGVWIQDWELKSNYGVHPSSVRKLRKEGLLSGRDLKKEDGSVCCTIYLVSENQEFIKKHPKQDSKIKMTILDAEGHIVEL